MKAPDVPWSVALARDGTGLAYGSWDKKLHFLDQAGKELFAFPTEDLVKGVAVATAGATVVAGSYDRYLYALSKDGKMLWRYKVDNCVRAADVSADGSTIAAGTWRGSIYLLNRRGDLLWKERIDRTALDVAVSDDGNLIVAGLEDGAVIAFNKRGGKSWEFRTKGAVRAVDISPDGSRVVAGGEDSVLYALSRDGDLLFKYEVNETVVGARFVCMGAAVAVATNYSYIHFLNREGDVVLLRHAPEDLWSFDATREGSQLAFATKEGNVIVADNTELAALVVEDGARRIGQIAAEGVSVAPAEALAKEALKQIKAGQVTKALETIQQAEGKAGELRTAGYLARAEDSVKKAQAALDKAKGFDTRKAAYLLGVARRAKAGRAYESSMKFAASAQADAEETLKAKRKIAEGDERTLPEVKVDEAAPLKGRPATEAMPEAPAEEPEAEAAQDEEEVADEVEEQGGSAEEVDPAVSMARDVVDEEEEGAAPEAHEAPTEEAEGEGAAPEIEEPMVSEPYVGVKVFEGRPHEGGRPECKGSTLKVNGECAVCVTFDMMKQSVDLAKQIKPRPPAEVLKLLKEAKEARDARDFAKSYFVAQKALNIINEAMSGAAPQAAPVGPAAPPSPPPVAPRPPPAPPPTPSPIAEEKKKKGFMRR